jgi:squalene-associated FAD-dependent desaturase
MPHVIVIGGGLAGLAAAAALGDAGYQIDLYESRPFLGGRATSYTLPNAESVDNCQHILLKCCVNLLNFYERLGVRSKVEFFDEIPFMEPGGRVSVLKAGLLPAPIHFSGSFLRLRFLRMADKIAIGRALLALRLEYGSRADLEFISMLDWLREKKQTERAIDRFWRPVLVSAINEELDRMAAAHGFQVFWLGFLASNDSYQMGVPAVPLGQLYSSASWTKLSNVSIHFRSPVERLDPDRGVCIAGEWHKADAYISAVPYERIVALTPGLEVDVSKFEHSSITGIHLWFDRPVTKLAHAALLDRNIQWFFNKDGGKYLQLVVSASKGLLDMGRAEVVELAVKELGDFLPAVKQAKLVKAHVVKEVRATFSALPGLEAHRPGAVTKWPNVFLAGDWTRSGWPATMEGAVRSGYLAAEAVTGGRFLIPDVA